MQYSDFLLTCAEVAPLLPWLGDGSLADDQRQRVLQHLTDCESCAAEARAFHATCELLRAEPFPDAALPGGRAIATGILEREAARARPGWTRWAWAPAAALLAVSLLVTWRPGRTEVPTPPPSPLAAELESLPALRIVDDERGRSVWLSSPSSAAVGGREDADRKL